MFAVVTLLAGVILPGVLGVATLLWGELEHWRASRRRMGTKPGHRGTGEAVVVLGFRNAGRRANVINRWRVRAGLRSQQPELGPSRLILSGGSVAAKISEADLMAEYAREKRGYRGQLITEPDSRSTWANVQNVIPLIADADRIKIVSNSLHAEKARLYLRELRPDLAERLVPGSDYRFGELIIIKPALAILGRRNFRRLERKARTVGLRAGTTLPTADLNSATDANLSP